MASIIREIIQDRGYVPDDDTIESNDRMGPYIGPENSLVVLFARNFVNKNPSGMDTSTFTKKHLSDFTLCYYETIQEDIIEFATIIIVPSNALDTSIFQDDMSVHGMTVLTEEEIAFDPTHNVLVPRHCLASSADLQEMEEKGMSWNDLPKIYAEDRICKWYGFKRGSIVRIERDYCDEVYYRAVI